MKRTEQYNKRLTKDEFDFCLKHSDTKFREKTIDIGRRYLVDGEAMISIANKYDISRQAVSNNIMEFWDIYERLLSNDTAIIDGNDELPIGWETVTLNAPKSLIADFKNQLKDYITERNKLKGLIK